MQGETRHTNLLKAEPYFIWVLAPQLETADPNLKYYYDFDANIKEFEKAFAELQLPWQWQYTTINDYKTVIDKIADSANGHIPLVLNLCDGDEVNGAPGLSVIRYLEEKQLLYTGARETYYHLTTSKITMKQAFDKAGVSSSPWRAVINPARDVNGICGMIGTPVIIKPAVSGGSMGLGLKNVVNTDAELKNVAEELYKGYHGWDFTFGGLVAERFITGPEYTALVVGSYDQPETIKVYQPVERVFNEKLPEEEKFLSFDRLWDTYENEKPVGEKEYENLWEYYKPGENINDELCRLSIDAYCAVEGTGYGRVDIRMDKETGKLYVLEVNAQCGLSEDENYTSIGAMVRLGNISFAGMIGDIIENALTTKILQNTYAPLREKTIFQSGL
jgi:D-alanine-D-alanine ligase